jgi:hypothetical protein
MGGKLRLGLPSMEGILFAKSFALFRELYPNIEVQLFEHGGQEIVQTLHRVFFLVGSLAKLGQHCDNGFSHTRVLNRCEEPFCVFLLHMEVVGVLRREDLEKNQRVGIVLLRGRV